MSTCKRRSTCTAWIMGVVIGLVTFASLCGYANGWDRQDEKGLWISPEASFRYGEVHGYLQTPRGGSPGTTSTHRPTFREVGITGAPMADVSVTAGLQNHALYAGARLVYLSGSDVLDSPLVSHGTTFPAGSPVKSNVQLNWYRVGYQYHFLYSNDEGAAFGFYPAVGLVLLDFKYKLSGPGGLSAGRSYIQPAPQIGLDCEWRPKGRFSVSGGVTSSLPFSNMPFILSTEVVGKFRLWGTEGSRGLAFLGIGYDRVEYKDKQDVPNHIKADMGPEVIVGLEVNF
jgi:hypothetical protein